MSNEVANTVNDVAETVAAAAEPAQKIATTATSLFFKSVGKVKRFSPEILMVAGVAGVVTAGVLACKATLKLESVVEKAEQDIEDVKHRRTEEEFENESEYNKALTKAYVRRGFDIVKLYTPALSVGVLSIGALLGAHGIMSQRQVALAAALKATESAFGDYRRRVVEQFGEEKDRDLRFGIVEKEIPEYDEDGQQVGTKKTLDVEWSNGRSGYARLFDETNDIWSKVPGQNQMTLAHQQNWANDRLNARGYLFLNDVYKMLGFPDTTEGQIVGWLRRDHEDSKDGYVEFGLDEIEKQGVRDFVNGFERSCWLDFNVDGVIHNKI
jgi:uncharacterized OsmC-like protein